MDRLAAYSAGQRSNIRTASTLLQVLDAAAGSSGDKERTSVR
jgi:hypothetical protein